MARGVRFDEIGRGVALRPTGPYVYDDKVPAHHPHDIGPKPL